MDPLTGASGAGRPASQDGLAFERRGSGEPLVLLHGLGSRRQVWEPILDALAPRPRLQCSSNVAAHHDVIAVDLPGFGASAADDTAPTVDGFATRLEAFLAELGIAYPHVAGSSMGGGIALELGRRGVARSVTAFSPVGFWNTAERVWAQSVLRGEHLLGRVLQPVTPALSDFLPTRALFFGLLYGRPWRLEPAQCVADVDGLLGAANFAPARKAFAAHRFDSEDLGKLPDIPVTVAWGTRDVILPYATQHRRARAALPGAIHVDLPGCGHLPFSDDPALCARVVLGTTR